MTKNQLTREENVQAVFDLKAGYTLGLADVEILKRVARMALAAMDSEPVAWTWQHLKQWHLKQWHVTNDEERARDLAWDGVKIEPLYRHAQPSLVPDKMTYQDGVLFVLNNDMSSIERGTVAMRAWNACRAAMLQAGNSPVIPDEMTSEQAYEIGDYHGDPVDVFARGANWMRQHIIDSTLAAAPQSPGSEPATVRGKWIPVSERMPEDRTQVILWDAEIGEVTSGHYSHKTQTFYHCGDAIENEITHWMPTPAAPQEVKP